MNRTSEYYASGPNLMRLAKELATYEDPDRDRVLNALGAMLAEYKGTKTPETNKASDTKDNNQKFNDLLNSCKDPRAMYNALLALESIARNLTMVVPRECFLPLKY